MTITTPTGTTKISNPCDQFGTIRRDALDYWDNQYHHPINPIECQWQNAAANLNPGSCNHDGPHDTHISLYCCLADAAAGIRFALEDRRCDHIPVGVDGHGDLHPPCDPGHRDTEQLRLWHLTLLRVVDAYLDDLQTLLKIVGTKKPRDALSLTHPGQVDRIQCFVNNTGKHGAKDPGGLYEWGHHVNIFFDDAGIDHPHRVAAVTLDTSATIDTDLAYNAIAFPAVYELVALMFSAVIAVDEKLRANPEHHQVLAGRFGRCANALS